MAKEFIITEGDIDNVVDSLLAEAPPSPLPPGAGGIARAFHAIRTKIDAGENVQRDILALKTMISSSAAITDDEKAELLARIENNLFPRFAAKAKIDVHDWGSTKGKGGVSVVDGFKYKGSSKNTTSEKFIKMYINNKIATAMIDKLATQADFEINEAMYDKESFFKDFILPRDDSEWDDLIYTVKTIGEAEAGDEAKEDEAKDAFETLANLLKDKKVSHLLILL